MKDFTFDLVGHLERQRRFSENTFGPGMRTAGVVDHIRKELLEIEANPGDLEEWIDVILLAFDGAWRTGADPDRIVTHLVMKQMRNERRTWPDWRTAPADKAIEHVRGEMLAEEGDYYTMKNSGNAIFVKEGRFFEQQGGLVQEWGSRWKKVRALSIEHARKIGAKVWADT
jgi:hypothetical protein